MTRKSVICAGCGVAEWVCTCPASEKIYSTESDRPVPKSFTSPKPIEPFAFTLQAFFDAAVEVLPPKTLAKVITVARRVK